MRDVKIENDMIIVPKLRPVGMSENNGITVWQTVTHTHTHVVLLLLHEQTALVGHVLRALREQSQTSSFYV